MPSSIQQLFSLIVGAAIGAVIVYFWLISKQAAQQERLTMAENQLRELDKLRQDNQQLTVLQERLTMAENQLRELDKLRQDNQQLTVQVAEAAKEREADKEKIAWSEQSKEALREAFQSLAAQALQTNTEEFIKRAHDQLYAVSEKLKGDWGAQKEQINGLVTPLNESLRNLNEQVQSLERKREGAYKGLEEQLRSLFETQRQLQTTTDTLAQAMKSSTARGRWGEIQLRRVVELAGMVEHVDFDEQISSDSGRPDMLIHLPKTGSLPVDAKAPMEAFLASAMAETEQDRKEKLRQHATSTRQRIKELAGKQYWKSFDGSPEFVVMFLPNDACLTSLFEADPELLDFALASKVLLTTPVSLLGLLKTIAYGWQQQQVAKSAKLIADAGRQLYERVGTLTGYLSSLGKKLNGSVEDYNKAISSLETRIMPSVRRLKELGASTEEIGEIAYLDHRAKAPLTDNTAEVDNDGG